MKNLYSFVLIGVLGLHCDAKIYEPCELAKELYLEMTEMNRDHLVEDIPLLVCIAGYHDYDSDFQSYRIDKDIKREYFGIFGQSKPHLAGRNLEMQLDSFKKDIFDLNKFSKSPMIYRFFKHICSGQYVKSIMCNVRLNHHVWSKFQVPVPKAPKMLYGPRQADPVNDFNPFF
uniref:Sperm acrosome-associated protein 5 n=1 Tax=Lygus hesperus TaxID=30085 RepID=A0A0A9WDT8_LYGHE